MKRLLQILSACALVVSGAQAQEPKEIDGAHLMSLVDTCKAITKLGAGAATPDLSGVGLSVRETTYDTLVELVSNAFRSRYGNISDQNIISPTEYGQRVALSMTNSYQPENPQLWSGNAFSGDGIAMAHVFSRPLPQSGDTIIERGHCEIYAKGWLSPVASEHLARSAFDGSPRCRTRNDENWSLVACENSGHPLDIAVDVEVFEPVTDGEGVSFPATVKLRLNHEAMVSS
ncbi:MAG: hypothetical protein AB8B47_12155 [Roseobacter sp.]